MKRNEIFFIIKIKSVETEKTQEMETSRIKNSADYETTAREVEKTL